MSEQIKVLTEKLKRLYDRRSIEIVCYWCNEPIKVGNRFVIRYGGSRPGAKIRRYHEECWDKLFLDL